MKKEQQQPIPPGWAGGYEESNPAFSYPHPDLSSVAMNHNLQHVKLIKRQIQAEWPQFSWQTIPGEESSRCYQMFSPYISRIGYTNTGRAYSIICPQQGTWIKGFGTLNVEVTVTKTRGWVNEDTREMYADLIVKPKLWFSPDASQSTLGKIIWDGFKALAGEWPFPATKKHAMQLHTSLPGNPDQEIFPLLTGLTTNFKIPDFARHDGESWTQANLEVEIGSLFKTNSSFVDEFNQLVMNAFNLASGNLLAQGNVLAWNIWASEPQLADYNEWMNHATYWRHSIDVDHRAPTGSGTNPQYFDGTPFKVDEFLLEEAIHEIIKFITSHLYRKHHILAH
ncbi:MAG: hypothetical protein KTR22_00050 [Flavobacteriaceae bacterium]|nr:hypothetical protein [Flavobacteriaceae bacterium]